MGRTSDAKQRLIQSMLELIWVGSYAGTSVDEICQRADVKKGSFYYFFESKADLAAAAIEAGWEEFSGELNQLFDPSKEPVDRLLGCVDYLFDDQKRLHGKHGRVLGCPMHTIGAELSASSSDVEQMLKDMLTRYLGYFENTLREAAERGDLRLDDPAATSRLVFFYMEGLLTQARIWNDLDLLQEMKPGVCRLIGLPVPEPAALA